MTSQPRTDTGNRGRKRRWLRILGYVLATPVVLIAVVLLALHTSAVQSWLKGKIEARAAERLNGTLEIGSLELSLFSGTLALGGVKVKDDAGAEVVTLESLAVSVDLGSVLGGSPVVENVALDGVSLHLVQFEDGGSNLKKLIKPKPPEPPPPEPPKPKDTRIRVDSIAISGIDVIIDKPDGTRIAIDDFGLQASVDAVPSTKTVKLSVPRIVAGLVLEKKKDGLILSVRSIETGLDVDLHDGAGRVALLHTRAEAEIVQTGAAKRVASLDLGAVSIDIKPGQLSATLDKLLLGAVVLQALEVRGGIDGSKLSGEQAVQLLGLKIDAKRLNTLLGKELLMSDVDIETKISGPPERIALDTSVRTGGGELMLEGHIDASDPAAPRYDVWLASAGLEGNAVVRSEKVPAIHVGGLRVGVRGGGARKEDIDADLGLWLGEVRVGSYAIDEVLVQARFDGGLLYIEPVWIDAMGQKVLVTGSFDPSRKEVDVRVTVDGDVGVTLERLKKAGLDIKTSLPRGALDLKEGVVTIALQGNIEGVLTADVAIHDAPVAGGAIAADLHAKVERNLDAGPGDKKVLLRALDGVVELKQVNLKQVLALRAKQLTGLTGTVSGKITIADAPDEPKLSYELVTRTQASDAPGLQAHRPTLVLTARGKGSKHAATLDLDVTGVDADKRVTILKGKATAPLVIDADQRGLSPHEPLTFELDVEERTLAELRPFLPERLLVDPKTGKPRELPNGTVSAKVRLAGTAAAPSGTIAVDVEAPALGSKRQKLDLDARIATDRGRVSVAADVSAWLDADAPAVLKGTARAELSRSPLLPGPREISWSLDLDLGPQELGALPLEIVKLLAAKGRARAQLALSGNASDALGTVDVKLEQIHAAGKGPADATVHLEIGAHDTDVAVGVALTGQPVLRLSGKVGRPGTGLLAALRDKTPGKSTADKLGNPSLALALEIPDHAPATWAGVRPELAALPGRFAGRIDIAGDLKTPTAKGSIGYQDFETLAGTPGRVSLDIDAGADKLAASVGLGAPTDGRAPVHIAVSAPRAAVPRYLARKKCFTAPPTGSSLEGSSPPSPECAEASDAKLPIEAHIVADKVDVKTLVPSFAIDDRQLLAAGKLSWSLDGTVVLDPEPRYAEVAGEKKKLPPIAPESQLAGKLALEEGIVGIPGTSRRYHDVAIRLHHDLQAVTIDGISLRESDRQRAGRKLDVSGKLSIENWQPAAVDLVLSSDEWLVFGHEKVGPADAPRGTLTMNATVGGRLDRPVKSIEVSVAKLELLIPDRFLRAHQPEETHLGDVIYLDETNLEKGKLPVSFKVASPSAEDPYAKKPNSDAAKDDGAAPFDGSGPKGPERGLDVHVRIPKKIHVLQDPINLYALGEIHIKRRGSARTIDGKLKAVGGDLSLGGKKHALQKGHILFDKEHPGGQMDLLFGRREHNAALRDVSDASGGELVTIHLEGPLDNRKTTLGGAGSPGTLFDLLSMHNAGRPRYASQPDMPATNTVQTPQYDNLLLLSYLSVNVPHLLFLDKVAAWSDAYDARATEGYGQVRHYEAEGYSDDGDFRVRMEGRPRGAGQSAAEIQLDYLFLDSAQTAVGVGAAAGSRLGGGPGLFFEWSSKD